MGNQLVLSGSAAQLQEAEAALAKFNQPPQSLLIEWRVDGASSSQQAGVGLGRDATKRQWLLEGNAQQYQRSQNDSWQVRGLSAYRCYCRWAPINRSPLSVAWRPGGGADAAGERPLCHRHPDWRQSTDSLAASRPGWSRAPSTGAERHRGERCPGQWLTVGSSPPARRSRAAAWAPSCRGQWQSERSPDPADPGHAPVRHLVDQLAPRVTGHLG